MENIDFDSLDRAEEDEVCPKCGERLYLYFERDTSIADYTTWLVCRCGYTEKE